MSIEWIYVDLRKAEYSHPEWDFDCQWEHDESLEDLEAIVFKPGNVVMFNDNVVALIGTLNPVLGTCDCCSNYTRDDVIAYCEAFDFGQWFKEAGTEAE